MKIGLWSTAAGSNNATPPDGWPEGQAPSTVNDCAREMMAAIRTYLTDAQYFDAGNTPSFLSTTSFSLNAVDVTSFHVGRRVKMLDGAATKYATINSVSGTTVLVRLDPGMDGLTSSLSSVAISVLGSNNPALPPMPLYRRNVIINGSMDIWQRSASFTPANNANTYTADRWAWQQSASCAVNVSRAEYSANAANVPSIAQAGHLITSSLRISVSAVDAALAAAEHTFLRYCVEGYDWRQVAHRPQVLSFWANTNRSGVYCVALRNSPPSASFVANYTLSAVNTWTRFAITVGEAPTTVSWNYSQSIGCEVTFAFGVGSNYQGGAGNWTAANILATSSQQNFVASAGNVFMITGVQLEVGTTATDIEFKHYADELARCQRYYWKGLPAGSLNFNSYTVGGIASWPVHWPVTMRVAPAVSANFAAAGLTDLKGTPTVAQSTTDGCRLIASASVATINGNIGFTNADYIEADAEL